MFKFDTSALKLGYWYSYSYWYEHRDISLGIAWYRINKKDGTLHPYCCNTSKGTWQWHEGTINIERNRRGKKQCRVWQFYLLLEAAYWGNDFFWMTKLCSKFWSPLQLVFVPNNIVWWNSFNYLLLLLLFYISCFICDSPKIHDHYTYFIYTCIV